MTWGKNLTGASKVKDQPSSRSMKVKNTGAPEKAWSPPIRPQSTSSSVSSVTMAPLRQFPKEVDGKGNVEYKYRLINIPEERMVHLRTQMKWRLEEGRGEALYRIGVMDDGEAVGLILDELTESLETLKQVASPLGFETSVLEKFEGIIPKQYCALVSVQKSLESQAQTEFSQEIRVAIVGPYETGKSSIAGLLTRGVTDDGRGRAGRCVAVHKHEIRHGRTSSFSSHLLPQKSTEFKGVENVFSDFESINQSSPPSKIVSLLDTAGHPKSLTSCIRGISSRQPDYFLICIDVETAAGNAPDRLQIALEFVALANSLKIQYFLVITKIDTNIKVNDNILKLFSCNFMDMTKMEDLTIQNESIPLFAVSTVSGQGMETLGKFLNHLEKPKRMSDREKHTGQNGSILSISKDFLIASEEDDEEEGQVSEDKLIVVGVVKAGRFQVNETIFVGPDIDTGCFARATIVSMRCASDLPIIICDADSTVSMSLKFLDCDDGREYAHRGAFVCKSPADLEARLFRTFDVSGMTLKSNEQVVVFNGAVSQTARVVTVMHNLTTLQFDRRAEYLLYDHVFVKRGPKVLVGRVE